MITLRSMFPNCVENTSSPTQAMGPAETLPAPRIITVWPITIHGCGPSDGCRVRCAISDQLPSTEYRVLLRMLIDVMPVQGRKGKA